MRQKTSFRNFDKTLFLMPVLIFCIGIVTIYSASFKSQQTLHETLAMKQIFWMGVGVLTVFLMVRTDYFKLQDLAWPLYGLSLLL